MRLEFSKEKIIVFTEIEIVTIISKIEIIFILLILFEVKIILVLIKVKIIFVLVKVEVIFICFLIIVIFDLTLVIFFFSLDRLGSARLVISRLIVLAYRPLLLNEDRFLLGLGTPVIRSPILLVDKTHDTLVDLEKGRLVKPQLSHIHAQHVEVEAKLFERHVVARLWQKPRYHHVEHCFRKTHVLFLFKFIILT